MSQQPVFLEQSTYRQRRLRDVMRVLPILGSVLWLIPLLWPQGEDGMSMSSAAIYIFGVWIALIAASALVSRRLGQEGTDEDDQADGQL